MEKDSLIPKINLSYCSRQSVLKPIKLQNINYYIEPYMSSEKNNYSIRHAEAECEKEILIHGDIAEQLSNELGDIAPQVIYMGYNTDPYQFCEKVLTQTREALESLVENGLSASILTNSDLVLRDIDLLQQMNDASVIIPVAFENNNIRSLFEKHTIDTEQKIETLQRLKDAGIKTSALINPIIPYVTNPILLIKALTQCADTILVCGLNANEYSTSQVNNLDVQYILNEYFRSQKNSINAAISNQDHLYWTALKKDLELVKEIWKLDIKILL